MLTRLQAGRGLPDYIIKTKKGNKLLMLTEPAALRAVCILKPTVHELRRANYGGRTMFAFPKQQR